MEYLVIALVVVVVVAVVIFRKSVAVMARTAEEKSLGYSLKVRQKNNDDLESINEYLATNEIYSPSKMHKAFDKGDSSGFTSSRPGNSGEEA